MSEDTSRVISTKSSSESAPPQNQPLLYKDTLELNGRFPKDPKVSSGDTSIEITGSSGKPVILEEKSNAPHLPQKQYSFAQPARRASTSIHSKVEILPTQVITESGNTQSSVGEKTGKKHDLDPQISSSASSKLSNADIEMSINMETEANQTIFNLNDITDPFENTPDTSTPSHNRFSMMDETPSGKSGDEIKTTSTTSNIFKKLAERENNGNYGNIENDSDMGIVLGEIDDEEEEDEEDDNSRPDDSYLPINLKVGARRRVFDDSYSNTDQVNVNLYANNGMTQKDGDINEEVNKALRQREELEKAAVSEANDTTGYWKGSKVDETQLSHEETRNEKTYDNILVNNSFNDHTPMIKTSEQQAAHTQGSSVFVQVPGTGEKSTGPAYDLSVESPLKQKTKDQLFHKSQTELNSLALGASAQRDKTSDGILDISKISINDDNDKVVVSDSDNEDSDVNAIVSKNGMSKSVIEVVSSQGSVSGTQITQHIETVGTYQLDSILDSLKHKESTRRVQSKSKVHLSLSSAELIDHEDQPEATHATVPIIGSTISISPSSPILDPSMVSQDVSDIEEYRKFSSSSGSTVAQVKETISSSRPNDLSVLREEERENDGNDNLKIGHGPGPGSSNEAGVDDRYIEDEDDDMVRSIKRRKTTVITSDVSQPASSGGSSARLNPDIQTKETQLIEGVSQFSEVGYQLSLKEASTYNYLEQEGHNDNEYDPHGGSDDAGADADDGDGNDANDDDVLTYRIPDTAVINNNSFNGSFSSDQMDVEPTTRQPQEREEIHESRVEEELAEINENESDKVFDESACKVDTSIWLSAGTSIYPGSIQSIHFKEEAKLLGDGFLGPDNLVDLDQREAIIDALNGLHIDKLDVKDFEIRLKDDGQDSSSGSGSSSSSGVASAGVPSQRIYAPLCIKVGDEVKYNKNKKYCFIITKLSYNPNLLHSLRCMRGFNTVTITKRPPRKNAKAAKTEEFEVSVDELYLTSPQGSNLQFKPFNDELTFKRYLLDLYMRKFDRLLMANALGNSLAQLDGGGGESKLNRLDNPTDLSLSNLIFKDCIFCTTNLQHESESKIQRIIRNGGGKIIGDFKDIIKINYDPNTCVLYVSESNRHITNLKNYRFAAVLSNEPVRTLKYLQGLSLNWPILCEDFIVDCDLDPLNFHNWGTYLLPAGKSMFRGGCEVSQNLFSFTSKYMVPQSTLFDQLLSLNRGVLRGYTIVVVCTKQKVDFLKFFFYALGCRRVKFISDLQTFESEGGFEYLISESQRTYQSHTLEQQQQQETERRYCIYVPNFQTLGLSNCSNELELMVSSSVITKQMRLISTTFKWGRSKKRLVKGGIANISVVSWQWLVQCMITRSSKDPSSIWELSD